MDDFKKLSEDEQSPLYEEEMQESVDIYHIAENAPHNASSQLTEVSVQAAVRRGIEFFIVWLQDRGEVISPDLIEEFFEEHGLN